mmetsp:Transcript_106592/g.270697  ORF Transcript_106592/g.270697 Transcript_106592/m.270697 type:complete len:208 (+) Transcript_106592:38-661(+)
MHKGHRSGFSQALPVHDAGAELVVLTLPNHHPVEIGQLSHDRSTHPDNVLSVLVRLYINFHLLWSQPLDLELQPISYPRKHSGASTHDDVLVQITSDVDLARENAVECCRVNARELSPTEHGVEQHLRNSKPLRVQRHHLAVGHGVVLLVLRGLVLRVLEGLLEAILTDIAASLLHVPNNLLLRGRLHDEAAFCQDLDHVFRKITAG